MKKAANRNKPQTLCWNCEKACRGCSWSRDFIPVKGWKAKPTKLYVRQETLASGKKKKYYTESFHVKECPEFELMKFIKKNLGKKGFDTEEILKAVAYYKRLEEERKNEVAK